MKRLSALIGLTLAIMPVPAMAQVRYSERDVYQMGRFSSRIACESFLMGLSDEQTKEYVLVALGRVPYDDIMFIADVIEGRAGKNYQDWYQKGLNTPCSEFDLIKDK